MSADPTGEKEKYLLVTTTGPAAEHWGHRFGLYKEAGTHNGAPYYVQLHDVNIGNTGKIPLECSPPRMISQSNRFLPSNA